MNDQHPMHDWLASGHALVLDDRGTGQEVLIDGQLRRQISAGGAVIVIGSAINDAVLTTLVDASFAAGRADDLLVVNPAHPATSHTYNPVLHSSPRCVASQVLNFISDQDSDTTEMKAEKAALLEGIIGCLQLGGLPYSFLDLGMFVMKPDAISALVAFIRDEYPCSAELRTLEGALLPFHGSDGELATSLLKARFAGLAGSMCMLGAGRMGQVFNSYEPDLVLHDAIAAGKIIYLAAPYVGRGSAASSLRRIVVSNLADAIARISQSHPKLERPALAVFTDAGGCNDPCIEQLLTAQGEKTLTVWISAPSLEDLGRESIDLREACLSRARTIVFFKPANKVTAQLYLKFLNADGDVAGATAERLLGFNSTQFVAVTDGSLLQWGDVCAVPSSRERSAIDLPRPRRFFHKPLTGADQFTQTVPV